MWYVRRCIEVVPVLAVLAMAGVAHAATLDVCPTCTHTTLDSAFAAAAAGDTIVLDGPDNDITLPPTVYTLTTDLVIDDTKAGLQIRGDSKARPDQIQVVGTGAGPVITVEQDQSLELRGFTVMGGTTGILAMKNSDLDIRRCLIDGVAGIGLDCVEPKKVYMAGSVITNCAGDAVKLDMGGEINIIQCTFLSNTGLGVNAVAGMANVVATMIHDCGLGMADPMGTALSVAGNYVTDAAGTVIVNPGGAVDLYPFTTPLDTATAFATTDNFPGEFDDAYPDFPFSGETAADLFMAVPVEFYARDFSNLPRETVNVAIGADERVAAAIVAAWLECYIIQNGRVRNWVSEGPATIDLSTEDIDLTGALLWIGNPTQTVPSIGIEVAVPANRVGGLPITVESTVDTTFGYVNYTFDLATMALAFPNIIGVNGVNTTDYELYIQPATVLNLNDGAGLDPDVLDVVDAAGSQAEIGRIFGFDTIPPRVVNVVPGLADQYLAPPDDGGLIDPRPAYLSVGWGLSAFGNVVGNVGANAGWLNGLTGDPQVFLDGNGGAAGIRIHVEFEDDESGFLPGGLPVTALISNPTLKAELLYDDFADTPGMAWWTRDAASDPELIDGFFPNPPPNLEVEYAVGGGPGGNNFMDAYWRFTGAAHDGVTQWHAKANIRVMDLAGNEATLDPSMQRFVPLKPLHLWWFPEAIAKFRSGPSSGAVTANPVFSWGLERKANGVDPKDPEPCFPTVRFYLWKLRDIMVDGGAPGDPPWIDVSGGWSVWMNPSNRTITLDTFVNATTQLRSVIDTESIGVPNRRFLMALQGYDEAGNLQPAPGGAIGDLPDVSAIAPLAYATWINPGASVALALDTKVQANFWYNYAFIPPGPNRLMDPGERSFGAATRIPLPDANGDCLRVEGGFTITMEVPDSVTAANNPRVYFELYEDGRFAVSGLIDPTSVPGGHTFVIPQDLLDPAPVGLTFPPGTTLDFLNPSWCDLSGTLHDRLGDDGPAGLESPYRQRDVKYQLLLATRITDPGTGFVYDQTPATVEFTVTVDRGLKDDQPIKTFTKE